MASKKQKQKKENGGEEREEIELYIIQEIAQINNTPQVKSDLGKGRANVQFQASQGMKENWSARRKNTLVG